MQIHRRSHAASTGQSDRMRASVRAFQTQLVRLPVHSGRAKWARDKMGRDKMGRDKMGRDKMGRDKMRSGRAGAVKDGAGLWGVIAETISRDATPQCEVQLNRGATHG